MLHRMQNLNQNIHGTSPDHLRKCLSYLQNNNFSFISVEELVIKLREGKTIKEKSVAFTMDDGFADQLEVAAPIFLEYNCPITVFLITGMLDNNTWPWDDKILYMFNSTKKNHLNIKINKHQLCLKFNDAATKKISIISIQKLLKTIEAGHINSIIEQISHQLQVKIPETPPDQFRFATWDIVKAYEKKGVAIGAHTNNHHVLSKLDSDSAKNEIINSWQRVQEELVSPCKIFCYPTGRFSDYGPREISTLKELGFVGAVSTTPAQVSSYCHSKEFLYHLPRLNFPNNFTEFVHDVSWLGHLRNKKSIPLNCLK